MPLYFHNKTQNIFSDREFEPQIAYRNADWVLCTWTNWFKMSTCNWKSTVWLAFSSRCLSCKQQGVKKSLQPVQCKQVWAVCVSAEHRSLTCFLGFCLPATKHCLSLVLYDCSSLALLLSLLGQISSIWPNNVLPLGWAYKLRERDSLQRIIGSCLYNCYETSEFTYFLNLFSFLLRRQSADSETLSVHCVLSQQQFLRFSSYQLESRNVNSI